VEGKWSCFDVLFLTKRGTRMGGHIEEEEGGYIVEVVKDAPFMALGNMLCR